MSLVADAHEAATRLGEKIHVELAHVLLGGRPWRMVTVSVACEPSVARTVEAHADVARIADGLRASLLDTVPDVPALAVAIRARGGRLVAEARRRDPGGPTG